MGASLLALAKSIYYPTLEPLIYIELVKASFFFFLGLHFILISDAVTVCTLFDGEIKQWIPAENRIDLNRYGLPGFSSVTASFGTKSFPIDSSRFYITTSSSETAQKFQFFQVVYFAREQEINLGEHSAFCKPST